MYKNPQEEALLRIKRCKSKKSVRLDLAGLDLEEIPEEVWELDWLIQLNAGQAAIEEDGRKTYYKNQIRSLSPKIGNLKRLRTLDLGNNQLEVLPDSIGELRELEFFFLEYNQLSSIPESIGNLLKLRKLDLRFNRLSQIPYSLVQLQFLEKRKRGRRKTGLGLFGNRFGLPDEIFNYNPPELIYYLLEVQVAIKKKQAKPLHEAKLIFIGSGEVGKTSLIKRLLGKPFDEEEKMTEGIVIYPWQAKRGRNMIKLNIWDFGGQEIMHATHRFFMTRRSVYVLVANPRMEDKYGDTELEYWLKLIRSYAGSEIPIIVCINKCDIHKMDFGKGSIKDKYPNIVGFVETSAKLDTGIDKLERLVRVALKQKYMRHVDDIMLKGDLAIKNKLETENRDYMSYPDYESLCKELFPKMQAFQKERLLRLLHDLGIMLNFRDDEKQALADTQVLNPEWVTKGVYSIITSPKLIEWKGILGLKQVGELLDRKLYARRKEWQFIVDIMEKFELSFSLPNAKGKYFVPGAFPKDRPRKLRWEYPVRKLLRFQYHYDVLPDVIISRFISNVHNLIKERNFWRNGVMIQDEGQEALIRSDPADRKIFIEIGGEGNKRSLLAVIRSIFKQIHDNLEGIRVQEFIPLDVEGKALADYEVLLAHEELREEYFLSSVLRKRFNVSLLLDGYESRESREDRRKRMEEEQQKNTVEELKALFLSRAEEAPKNKILFLASRPSKEGRKRMDKEHREIQESLQRANQRSEFSLSTRFALSRLDLSRAILDEKPQIIHFSGAGKAGEGILIEDKNGDLKVLSKTALGALFELFEGEIDCVILNACFTQAQAQEIAKYVPYVIGMNGSISDKAAIAFARSFYDAIGNGREISFAFRFAKNSLDLEELPESAIPQMISE